jgi:hypothetical protein
VIYIYDTLSWSYFFINTIVDQKVLSINYLAASGRGIEVENASFLFRCKQRGIEPKDPDALRFRDQFDSIILKVFDF